MPPRPDHELPDRIANSEARIFHLLAEVARQGEAQDDLSDTLRGLDARLIRLETRIGTYTALLAALAALAPKIWELVSALPAKAWLAWMIESHRATAWWY